MTIEHTVEVGECYEKGELRLEVTGEPYANAYGLVYAECRLLQAGGFETIDDRDIRTRFLVAQILADFAKIDASEA